MEPPQRNEVAHDESVGNMVIAIGFVIVTLILL
jgi:hypothetical protein